ncbi:alkaline phosphatase family protein [Persicobacter psychrovividus]|uniref:Type I phosphodiesterase/nucleotide pyrophosphatase n=1 Tax=Persicobacter psychrovividus TaxID=387638 RepID=A0ABM7VMD5_9BACT|nr:hypothetical protein PEPS_44510 [Persicobacter psychrovividus]
MNSRIFLFLVILSNLIFTGCSPQEQSPKHVFIIGIDGLSLYGLKTANTPNLDKLSQEGVLSTSTRAVMPSITMPNWGSHLMGSGPEQHGILGNDWRVDNFKLKGVEADQDGYYPSIFKLVKEQVQGAKTAFFYNWGNLINLVNKKYLDVAEYEDHDGFKENYAKAFEFAKENKGVPTLIFLYTGSTDNAGHRYTYTSPEYVKAVEAVDQEIGHLIKNLKEANMYDKTDILVITDHGGSGYGHGGTSIEEMEIPWIIRGPGVNVNQKMSVPNDVTNTANVVASIFGINNIPSGWTGKVPEGIFVSK